MKMTPIFSKDSKAQKQHYEGTSTIPIPPSSRHCHLNLVAWLIFHCHFAQVPRIQITSTSLPVFDDSHNVKQWVSLMNISAFRQLSSTPVTPFNGGIQTAIVFPDFIVLPAISYQSQVGLSSKL